MKNIQWPDGIEYSMSNDHSKYAVSMDSEHPWVFIGDINRMESQYRRGGGGILIKNIELWKRMNEILLSYTDILPNPNFRKPITKRWWECLECLKCLE